MSHGRNKKPESSFALNGARIVYEKKGSRNERKPSQKSYSKLVQDNLELRLKLKQAQDRSAQLGQQNKALQLKQAAQVHQMETERAEAKQQLAIEKQRGAQVAMHYRDEIRKLNNVCLGIQMIGQALFIKTEAYEKKHPEVKLSTEKKKEISYLASQGMRLFSNAAGHNNHSYDYAMPRKTK